MSESILEIPEVRQRVSRLSLDEYHRCVNALLETIDVGRSTFDVQSSLAGKSPLPFAHSP